MSLFGGSRDNPEQRKPFLEHLEDLRRTLIWSAALFVLGLAVAVPLAPTVLALLKVPLAQTGLQPDDFLRIQDVGGGFSVAMRLIIWSGLLFSAPGIVLVIGNFVFPGLKPREKQAVTRGAGFAVALFVAGVCLGYFGTLRVALQMMFRINAWLGVKSEWVVLSDYVSFVLKLLLAFGLAFELPVVLVALGSVGIIRSDQLRAKRRHVTVGILVVAMLLTPPDVFTQVLMALPMWVLFELCIVLIRLKERARAERREKEGGA